LGSGPPFCGLETVSGLSGTLGSGPPPFCGLETVSKLSGTLGSGPPFPITGPRLTVANPGFGATDVLWARDRLRTVRNPGFG
ncbi:MAG: hypothetical protein KDB69_07225, partial [Acidimicrobiia bacterium]|nr:hypothetical protein [Acidimicrobiia bacterium]